MPPSFPSAWILFVLPFASGGAIAHAGPLRRLIARYCRLTTGLGIVGLGVFIAGLVGVLPVSWAILAVITGGLFAGLSLFTAPPKRSDGGEEGPDEGGWGRRPPPEDEPPPPPCGDGEVDWDQFDTLRAEWEPAPAVLL